ncbi:MAG: indolepyruvate oxidoreductase subunit beta [Chloroflexota bacterium]
MKKLNLLITGVGGQGVVLASDIVGEAAIAAGFDVKKTDTLGMAQRGGSVLSHVRVAPKVYSPLIKEGEVDVLLAFEKLEAARYGNLLRPGGVAIVNNQAVPPLAVILGYAHYPSDEEVAGIIRRQTGRVYLVEAAQRARELGNLKAVNTFMLGCLSLFAPFSVSVWKECIVRFMPKSVQELNLTAFDLGRKEIRRPAYPEKEAVS